MNTKILGIVIVCALAAAGGWLVIVKKAPVAKIHYHAGFQVYVNGVKQDFSGDQYMLNEPCTVAPKTPEEAQLDRVHLHDNVGDVAHVHANGVVWGDLFTNMHYLVDTNHGVEAYINGVQVDNILKTPIKPYDSLILLLGTHADLGPILQGAVTKQHILQIEKTSEGCGA